MVLRFAGCTKESPAFPSLLVATAETRSDANRIDLDGLCVANAAAGLLWQNGSPITKTVGFLRLLQTTNPGQLAVLVDSDVLWNGCSEPELLEAYRRTVDASGGADVVIAAEFGLYPPQSYRLFFGNRTVRSSLERRRGAVMRAFGLEPGAYSEWAQPSCGNCHPPEKPVYQFLNLGLLMGPAAKLRALFEGYHAVATAAVGGPASALVPDTGGTADDETAGGDKPASPANGQGRPVDNRKLLKAFRATADQFHFLEFMTRHTDQVTLDYSGSLSLQLYGFRLPSGGWLWPNATQSSKPHTPFFNSITKRRACFLHPNGGHKYKASAKSFVHTARDEAARSTQQAPDEEKRQRDPTQQAAGSRRRDEPPAQKAPAAIPADAPPQASRGAAPERPGVLQADSAVPPRGVMLVTGKAKEVCTGKARQWRAWREEAAAAHTDLVVLLDGSAGDVARARSGGGLDGLQVDRMASDEAMFDRYPGMAWPSTGEAAVAISKGKNPVKYYVHLPYVMEWWKRRPHCARPGGESVEAALRDERGAAHGGTPCPGAGANADVYNFLWLVEHDVRYFGNLTQFLTHYRRERADYVVELSEWDGDGRWEKDGMKAFRVSPFVSQTESWPKRMRALPPGATWPEVKVHKWENVEGMSRRFLRALDVLLDMRLALFGELFEGTVCANLPWCGFRDLRLDGFTPPFGINSFLGAYPGWNRGWCHKWVCPEEPDGGGDSRQNKPPNGTVSTLATSTELVRKNKPLATASSARRLRPVWRGGIGTPELPEPWAKRTASRRSAPLAFPSEYEQSIERRLPGADSGAKALPGYRAAWELLRARGGYG